jgi:hypothetical protein
VLNVPAITDAVLEAAFDATDTTVILGPDVETVYGTVPAGKTLRVLVDTTVPDDETLTLNGGLVLYSVSAALRADKIGSTSGGLVVDGGAISGDGTLYLPVDTDSPPTSAYATYQSVNFANKEVGSFVSGGSVSDIDDATAANITTIFGVEGGPDALTVGGTITSLSATFEVPAGKTLTLSGPSTFAGGDHDVTVTGTLILGSAVTAFAPGGEVAVDGSLVLEANSVITIASGETLIVTGSVSGAGTIVAQGDGSSGTITINSVEYTTTANGVVGDDLAGAAAAIVAETALTDGVTLDAAFDASSVTGIGSIVLDSAAATAIKAGGDGSTGGDVAVTSGITLAGTLTATTVTGTDSDLTATDFALSLTGTKVSIADSDNTGNTPKFGVLEFDAVQLQHSELIGPPLAAFHIGVKTLR